MYLAGVSVRGGGHHRGLVIELNKRIYATIEIWLAVRERTLKST
jgi:hypothetical protein